MISSPEDKGEASQQLVTQFLHFIWLDILIVNRLNMCTTKLQNLLNTCKTKLLLFEKSFQSEENFRNRQHLLHLYCCIVQHTYTQHGDAHAHLLLYTLGYMHIYLQGKSSQFSISSYFLCVINSQTSLHGNR